jgi:hypothetical protein
MQLYFLEVESFYTSDLKTKIQNKKFFIKRGLQPQHFLLYLTTLKQKAKNAKKVLYIILKG